MYLPVVQNQDADFLSRHKPLSGEWSLHPEVDLQIWGVFGTAEVDLFASEMTSHCPLWLSTAERTSNQGQDALVHTGYGGCFFMLFHRFL